MGICFEVFKMESEISAVEVQMELLRLSKKIDWL